MMAYDGTCPWCCCDACVQAGGDGDGSGSKYILFVDEIQASFKVGIILVSNAKLRSQLFHGN